MQTNSITPHFHSVGYMLQHMPFDHTSFGNHSPTHCVQRTCVRSFRFFLRYSLPREFNVVIVLFVTLYAQNQRIHMLAAQQNREPHKLPTHIRILEQMLCKRHADGNAICFSKGWV